MCTDRDLNEFCIQNALAKKLLKETGAICVHKVTRSGCTMSLIKACYEQGKRVVIFAPTIRVLKQVGRIIPTLTDAKVRIAPVLSNPELCRKVDRSLKLKFQFKRSCQACEFKGKPGKCVLQNLLINDFDIYCLTYDKLKALQKSTSSEAKRLLEKLRNCAIFILDEFTTAVIQSIATVEIVTVSSGEKVKLSTRLISNLVDDFKRSESDFWMTVALFLHQFESIKESGVYKNHAIDHLSDDGLNHFFINGWNRITQLTGKGRDTSKLQDVFLTCMAGEIAVTVENGHVKVTPRLEDALGFLREFTQTLVEDKLIFAVDSYQPSVDFDKVFGRHVTHRLWGENGDPLGTNLQQLILCDTAHWGSCNFCRDSALQQKVRDFVGTLLKHFPPEQVTSVTTNKKMTNIVSSWKLPKSIKLTWHRSDWMRGVSVEDRRIMVCIGGPYIPKSAYVSEAPSFNFRDFSQRLENLSAEEQAIQISKILRIDDTKSEFINAIGRVKDPRGRERDLVITLGMTYLDVQALLRQKSELSVSRPNITRPFSMGGLHRDGLWIARLWMDRSEVRVEDLPVVARIVRYVKEKKEFSASQVIPHETKLVVEKAMQYKEILKRYNVMIISKQGGVSFEQI